MIYPPDDDGVKGLIVVAGLVFVILLRFLPPPKKTELAAPPLPKPQEAK
jgi:hypothetical protein